MVPLIFFARVSALGYKEGVLGIMICGKNNIHRSKIKQGTSHLDMVLQSAQTKLCKENL